ncbi:MAG: hypothetical protein DVB22_000320 [Verrucomicrobia bacterium]|jgi:hypothetical protein|nr:MAG: hypothetical protein DVB22_000320 [Verrucomicrobiota bacterium]
MTKAQKSALSDRLLSIEFTHSAVTGSRVASKPGSPVSGRPRPKRKFSKAQVARINAFFDGTSVKTVSVE